MTIVRNAILDRHGRVLFTCSSCGQPITTDDFFELGLRHPDDGETQDDYFSAELLDDLSHTSCTPERRQASAGLNGPFAADRRSR